MTTTTGVFDQPVTIAGDGLDGGIPHRVDEFGVGTVPIDKLTTTLPQQ